MTAGPSIPRDTTAAIPAIEALISEYLQAGLEAPDDIVHFARSALGAEGPDDLARILRDECDESGMADLLLHAPLSLAAAIEPMLPAEGLNSASLTLLAAALLRRVPAVPVSFRAFDLHDSISLTSERAARFLSRFGLERRVGAIDRPFPGGNAGARLAMAAVAVRRNRPPGRPGSEEFLRDFARGLAESAQPDGRGVYDAVAFTCSVLAARDLPVEEALIAEWNSMEKIIAETEHFAALSRRYSMEFLMSRRVQPPAMGPDEARRRMALLDLAARTGLGRPLPVGPLLSVQDISFRSDVEVFDDLYEEP